MEEKNNNQNPENKPISQGEARLVQEFLKIKGKYVKGGFISLWRLRPIAIASQYGVPVEGLLRAIRRA